MKNSLRRSVEFFAIGALLSMTQACAETPVKHEWLLLQKAINLSSAACAIYPAINDIDACADKVVRRILADRDVAPERVTELIREQEAAYPTKHPQSITYLFWTKEQLRERARIYKLADIINTACAIPPAINDVDLCMDKAYHSILSSRDPHSGYLNPEEAEANAKDMSGELQGIGIEVAEAKDKAIGVFRVMESSPAERAGVLDGDRIVAIINDNERVLVSSFPDMGGAIKKIKGKPNTKVTLEILRGEQDRLLTITVVRGLVPVPMVTTDILIAPNEAKTKYAYIRLVHFGNDLKKKMVDAVASTRKAHPDIKGIVFDLRGNPGGLLDEVYEAVDTLSDSPDAFVSIRNNDGILAYDTAPGYKPPKPQPGDITLGLPIGVLIDGRSASASEIFAGSLKKLERSVTIGKGTWRKGTVQNIGYQPDGSVIKMTIAEYLIGSPTSWVAVQCVGVNPDIEYEAEGVIRPKKEMHECDLEGAVVSGGVSSDPSRTQAPLHERDPARYAIGLEMRDAVKVFDDKKLVKTKRLKKLLKIEDKPEGESEEK